MFLSTLAFFLANVFVKQVAHIPAMETFSFAVSLSTALRYGLRQERKAACRVKPPDIAAPRHFWYDGTVLLFLDAPANAARVGADDPISFADIYGHVRHFVLGESVKLAQWGFYAIAFSGVLLIERFDRAHLAVLPRAGHLVRGVFGNGV